MTLNINTQKEPSNFYGGNNIQDIYFYKDGNICGEFQYCNIGLATIKENEIICKDNYYSDIQLLGFNLKEVKKANKLNLERKDNFIYYSKSDSYLKQPYDLYIYVGEGGDIILNDKIEYNYGSDMNGAQSKMYGYYVKFVTGIELKYMKHERIVINDPKSYTLQQGETFSNSYGEDINHKCVSMFDTSEYKDIFKKHKINKPYEKGIIKKWKEYENKENYNCIIAGICHRTEYNQEYKNRDKLSEEIKSLTGLNITNSDLVKLLKVYDITKK